MPEGSVEEISGMDEEDAVKQARMMLEEAGMNKEVMERALGWDEFVFGLFTDSGREYLNYFKKKDFVSEFNSSSFVMLLTTD